MDSLYQKLSKNKGWRQTQTQQEQLMSKNLQSFANTSYGRGGVFGRDAGNGIGLKNSQSFANSHYDQGLGEDPWDWVRPSDRWSGIGSKNSQSFAKSSFGRGRPSGQYAGNGIEVEYDDGWGDGDGLKFYVSNKGHFGTGERDFYFYETSELTRIGIDTVKQKLAVGIVPKVPKGEQYESKNVRPFGNCSFGRGFQAEQRAQRDRQQEEKDRQALNWASEDTWGAGDSIGPDAAKSFGNHCIGPGFGGDVGNGRFGLLQAGQRALKDRKQEQFVRSPFNWAAPCDACSDDGSSNASAKGKGKNGGKKKHPWSNWTSPWKAGSADDSDSIGRNAVTGKFGLLQAEQRAQKKSWEEFVHSSSNLASGSWEGIIGGKKKPSSFKWTSAWDAGSDGGSINGSSKGKNGGKKKQSSFKSVSSSNAGDSDAGSDSGSNKASAKGKNWWELDYCAPSTAGDSDGGSGDGSNSDSNASAKGKNGGKKKKANGNVNVHICECCIFI